MTRVHIICEGQTEEQFVKKLLAPSFAEKGIFLFAILLGRSGHKGGRVEPQRLSEHVRNLLLGDKSAYCTTFFDFYALPSDFPGKAQAAKQASIRDKAACVQTELAQKLGEKLGQEPLRRFIPYVQMYEFEGLLFSDPARFAVGISQPRLAADFQKIRDQFPTPEEINDSPQTAPSKRIAKLLPRYQKPLQGVMAAQETGLGAMRQACALFDAWLKQLEAIR